MVIYQMRIWHSLGGMEASMDEVVIRPFDLNFVKSELLMTLIQTLEWVATRKKVV